MIHNSLVFGLILPLTVFASGWHAQNAAMLPRKLIASEGAQPSCESWHRSVSKLSDRQKGVLASQGALYTGDLILSERTVANCELRAQMSRYFGKLLRGEADEFTKKFAADHSREIVGILLRIWPSTSHCKALSAEGIDAEKYNLLADPALQPSAVSPLIGKIIAKEPLANHLAYVLFVRRMPQLRPSLLMRLAKARRSGDIVQQIYSLAILQSLGDQSVLAKFAKLSRRGHLSKYEAALIANLITKIRSGNRLAFADIEDLEYMNDR